MYYPKPVTYIKRLALFFHYESLSTSSFRKNLIIPEANHATRLVHLWHDHACKKKTHHISTI